ESAKKASDNIERQISFTKDYQDMGVKSATWQEIGLALTRARGALPIEHLSIKAEGTEYEIFADPLFEKVFYNLFENSLKHGGEGMTTISISTRETDEGLLILYEDDGVGIPENAKKFLFAQEMTPQKGLGMFLTGQILAITGITIVETGVPGRGARFEMLVPKGGFRKAKSGD
ncbi:MAG TPA: sensor histidine kinase, partial [Methanolinea sp.]|nr:sensor histidine kinase [Methanolinea sp.]